MKQATFRFLALAALLVLVVAPPAAGQANFGKYVALGDSLTAGFLSGGLQEDAQQRSYPALVARQAGVADFQLPLVGAPGAPPLLAVVGFNGASPVIVPRAANPGPPLNLMLPRPYDNLAVPGFTATEILNTVSDPDNPLSDLVLRGLGTQVQQGLVQQPTFATIWAGNNDVLGAAVSGIVIDGVTLTTPAAFEQTYRTLLGAFAQSGVQMAVANLPNVTALPYVNTLPPVVVNPATGEPVVLPDGSLVPLIGPQGPLSLADKVLLPASAKLAMGIGVPAAVGGTNLPLDDSDVLSASEVATISARVAALNGIIAQAASDFGAALVDINGFFNDIVADGYPVGAGIVLTTDFLTGGVFSYDGVHPTPVAYAVVANLFIDAINDRFGDSIPPVDLIPFVFGPDGSAGATVPLPGLGATPPVFAASSFESVRTSLGVAPISELKRIKEERRGGPQEPGLTLGTPERPSTPGLTLQLGGR
jgi:lysophospholipase L1-like esterase